jgi:hypothetical protein
MKVRLIAMLALMSLALTAAAQGPCEIPFPKPKIAFVNRTLDGEWVRYRFTVTNRASYSNLLFAASPQLPPCGNNTSASRTWLDIFDSTGKRLYGYCALTANADMASLSFAVKFGQPQPKGFFITLNDRRCNRVVKSNVWLW